MKLTNKVAIRWMIARDQQECCEIAQHTHGRIERWNEEDFRDAARETHTILLIAEIGEKVVGFVCYHLHRKHLSLFNLCVHPDHRRQGVGSAFLDLLYQKLQPHRRTSIRGIVRESDLTMQLFLRAQHYRCVEVIRGYFNGEEDGYRFDRYVEVDPDDYPENSLDDD